VSDVLIFTQRPDGTLVAQTAAGTLDGTTVTPAGVVPPPAATPVVARPALSFLAVNPDGTITQELFGPGYGGTTVLAQPKLAQRFVLHLFTPQQTILYRPKQGCRFVTQLRLGKSRNESDVFAAFAGAMPEVSRNMLAEELATDPPEERFAGARLDKLTVSKAVVTATITVANRAGAKLNITLPLNFRL
jgi:hypothetical protein